MIGFLSDTSVILTVPVLKPTLKEEEFYLTCFG